MMERKYHLLVGEIVLCIYDAIHGVNIDDIFDSNVRISFHDTEDANMKFILLYSKYEAWATVF